MLKDNEIQKQYMWKCDGSLHPKCIWIAIKKYRTDNLLNKQSAVLTVPPQQQPLCLQIILRFSEGMVTSSSKWHRTEPGLESDRRAQKWISAEKHSAPLVNLNCSHLSYYYFTTKAAKLKIPDTGWYMNNEYLLIGN